MLESYNHEFDVDLPGNPKLISNSGNTLLHKLASKDDLKELEEYLINKRGPVDVVDQPYPGHPFEACTPLLASCNSGKFAAVKLLVKHGAKIDQQCEGVNDIGMRYSTTPIYVAAMHGHFKIVKFLGQHGANVDIQTMPMGYTPLHAAVYFGHLQIAEILLHEFDADPHIPSKEDFCNYPLLKAAAAVDIQMMMTILSSEGSNPNVADSDEGMTALHLAVIAQDFTAVERLVLMNADVNAKLKSGHTPLDLAYNEDKDSDITTFLLGKGAVRHVDEDWVPFVFTLKSKCLSFLKKTVSQGSNVNCRLINGRTPLHMGVLSRSSEVVKFLIEKGADVDAMDFYSETPLVSATMKNDPAMVQLLIDKGANVNQKDNWGASAFHFAAMLKCPAAAKVLMANGANLNESVGNIGNPMLLAAVNRNHEVVQMLMDAGVDVNTRCYAQGTEYLTPLHAACSINALYLIKLLIRNGADVNAAGISHLGLVYPIHFLVVHSENYYNSFLTLIEAGAFFDFESTLVSDLKPKTFEEIMRDRGEQQSYHVFKNTVRLFEAVRNNDLDGVKIIASIGGLVNCCSFKLETPLMHASAQGYLRMVKLLLSIGAKHYLAGVTWGSPLHSAAKHDQRDVAIQLLKSGARLTYLCNRVTPIEVAMQQGHNHMVSLLVFIGKYFLETKKDRLSRLLNYKKDPAVQKVVRECGERAPPSRVLKAMFATD